MAVEIATAYLTILPSLQGSQKSISDQINRSVAPAADKAGKEGGKRISKGLSTGLKSVGAAAAGLFAVDKVTDFFKDANAEARESQKVGALTASTIKSTGGAANITAKQIGNLSTAISNKTGIDDEAVQSGANMLLAFTNIRNETGKGNAVFSRATELTTDLAKATGKSIPAASKVLGKALNDPAKGLSRLAAIGVTFTDGQTKQVKAMQKSGDTLGAQKVILAAVQKRFGGAAAASATAGEKLSVAFGNFKEQIGTALLPVIDKVEGVLTGKVIPALSTFFAQLQSGEGTGGKVAAAFKTVFGILKDGIGFVVAHKEVFAVLFAGVATGVVVFKAITLAMKAWTVATKIATGVTKAWALAQKALNIVMRLNPIGLVVTALVLLGLGLVAAYKHSEKFRDIVNGAFKAVKKVAKSVLDWLTKAVTTALSFIKTHWKTILAILAGPLGLAALAISKHWDSITGFFSDALSWVTGAFKRGWAAVKGVITGPIADAVAAVKTFFGSTGPIRTAARNVLDWFRHDFRWSAIYDVLTFPITKAIEAITKVIGPGGKLRTAFSNAVGALGRIWDGVKEAMKAPIRFVINTVLENGILAAFRKVAGALGLDSLASKMHVSLPSGFAAGGYTGPGGKYQPAGVVHADEYVVQKSARRRFESSHPGALDYLNRTGRLPGYANGGRVDATGGLINFQGGRFTPRFAAQLKLAQQMAGVVFSIFQGGWRPATSYSGTSHRGDAVDLGPVTANVVRSLRRSGIAAWDRTGMGNWMPHIHGVPLPGFGTALGSAIWQAQDYLRGGNGLGGRDNGAGSGDHSTGILAGLKGFVTGGFKTVVGFFKHLIEAPLSKLSQVGDSPFGQIVSAIPHKIADGLVDKIGGFAGGTSNAEAGLAWVGERGPELVNFHGGEQVFPHGRSMGMAGRGLTINGGVHGYSAEEIARKIAEGERRQRSLHPVRG